jgi:hypothetical protein
MRVELNIFSGRPNPSWELSPQDASALEERLTGLTFTSQSPSGGGLGYRGFILSYPTPVAGLSTQINIFNGVIKISEGGHTTHYYDTKGAEGWLIEQARKQGYGNILDQTIGSKDR